MLNQAKITFPLLNQAKITFPLLNQAKITLPLLNQAEITFPLLNQAEITVPLLNQAEIVFYILQTFSSHLPELSFLSQVQTFFFLLLVVTLKVNMFLPFKRLRNFKWPSIQRGECLIYKGFLWLFDWSLSTESYVCLSLNLCLNYRKTELIASVYCMNSNSTQQLISLFLWLSRV